MFMSLWAVTFLEYWKRTSSILAHRWDCSEFEDIEVMIIEVIILQFDAISQYCSYHDFLILGEAKARIYSIGTKFRS